MLIEIIHDPAVRDQDHVPGAVGYAGAKLKFGRREAPSQQFIALRDRVVVAPAALWPDPINVKLRRITALGIDAVVDEQVDLLDPLSL